MGLVLKILVGIFIVVGVASAYVGYTVWQGYQIVSSIDSENLEADLAALESGDCSKLPEIETRFAETKENLRRGCKNPALKVVIDKVGEEREIDLCAEALKSNSELDLRLNSLREICNQQEA